MQPEPGTVDTRYHHTQIGWVIIGVTTALAAFVPWQLPAGRLVFAGLFGSVLLFFGTLTVEVDAERLRLWFGLGLVRKTIPLASVEAWQAVRSPWYTGWGIRLGPGYVLWNVSGWDAVELALAGGRRFRVGTDEPGELVAALARAKGGPPRGAKGVP
jgi:hypothetical protein